MCTNSFRVYRLWLCLLVAETVAIAADASFPRPLATGQVSKRRSKRCKQGADFLSSKVSNEYNLLFCIACMKKMWEIVFMRVMEPGTQSIKIHRGIWKDAWKLFPKDLLSSSSAPHRIRKNWSLKIKTVSFWKLFWLITNADKFSKCDQNLQLAVIAPRIELEVVALSLCFEGRIRTRNL